MSGQKSRRGRLLNRLSIGLLAVSMTVLLAPVAAAQPEVDANAAITAAWEASGGDGGTLGPRNGDVYPAGQGFGQNFAGGKIFFTPATGARIIQGAILEKYESLGGPADSDLGFPTIDEGPGRAPDSRNTTFSATDKPVIFFTPATGARVVRGPINAAWDKLGGSAGELGVPAEDEVYRGDVVSQKFTAGELSYDIRKKTFTTVPPDLAAKLADLQFPDDPAAAISAARRAAGGALGPLGAPEGEPFPIGKDGLRQNFAGGAIFYTPATGANVVTGQVLAKYESVGGPEGDLGFPITSEVDGGLATESRMSSFAAEDKPTIFWTPEHGAVIVRGAMAAAWDKLDGAKGALGAPMADQTEAGDVVTQRFSGGVLSWDRSKNTFTTEPANLASELSGLEVPGQKAADASERPAGIGFQRRQVVQTELVVAVGPRAVGGPGRSGVVGRPCCDGARAKIPSRRTVPSSIKMPGSTATANPTTAAPSSVPLKRRPPTTNTPRRCLVTVTPAGGWVHCQAAVAMCPPSEDDLWGAPASVERDEEDKPPAPEDETERGRRSRCGRHRTDPRSHRNGRCLRRSRCGDQA